MRNTLLRLFAAGLICSMPLLALAQTDYRDADQLRTDLQALSRQYGANAQLQSLTKTPGEHDLWVLTLSDGNPDAHPALVIAGGVEGSHLLSVELAAELARDILENKKELLDQTTFYIFPNMNPDATAQYFTSLKYERSGNATNTDDDRDGERGEDPFEDLNGDGLITHMRVMDPTGDYITLEADPRVMVKADREKGQTGAYKLLSEGRDNDRDGHFNEDGPGGVSFNRNLTYNFPYFTPGAGEHPVSQPETRAVLDFLYERWNVYGILTFGSANNLSQPLKYNAQGARKRVVTSILKEDADLNKLLSDSYNELVTNKNVPPSVTEGGGFFEWSYFHFGRLALSTPAWWPPMPEKDTTLQATKNREANFLRWADQQNLADSFVEWTEVDHPDFPNQKVEVGGIAPFKMNNPPYEQLGAIVEKHSGFIEKLVGMQADLQWTNLKQENLGDGLTRITVDLHNAGILPTHTQMGDRSRWLQKVRVELKTDGSQEIISGRKIQLIERIAGDSAMTFTWLVKGGGSVELSAAAAHVGNRTLSIKL